MKIAGVPAKKPDLLREAIRRMDDAKLGQLITELAFSTRLEQSALHFARGEQRRRTRQAKKAAKAVP
ncbi:hypothetical protein [Stenotrophomonas pigmentata]|uniref:hypothetical protein n=1 Tax=Stenotrophomonas pigmentata TaxID=3055080 RepID=UPI0026EBAEA3|nr:hypothetical protein [Stenotrophomonas sp. 610A2]